MSRKELSGLFLSNERYAAALGDLANAACSITQLRLFHNEPNHTVELFTALQQGNTSVTDLDIYDLHAGAASTALYDFLSSPTSTCHPSMLRINSCHGVQAATSLGQGLASLSCHIVELHLAGLQDTELSAVLTPLAALQASPNNQRHLQCLELLRCSLGPNSLDCTAALASLHTLCLTDCVLSDATASELLSSAFLRPTQPAGPTVRLEKLQISGSSIGQQTGQVLATMLSRPTCMLEELLLNNNPTIGDAAVTAIAAGLAENTSMTTCKHLQRLELNHCDIGPVGAQALAAALRKCPLRTLALNFNHIASAGLLALLSAVTLQLPTDNQTPQLTLQDLQVEGNGIRGADLPVWPAGHGIIAPVQRLGLASNHLSDKGILMLEQAFHQCPTLVALDLTGNGVGPEGAAALVNLLTTQTQLQELRLDNNRLHDAGAASLLSVVLDHPALRVFRASSCRVMDLSLKSRLADATTRLAARGSLSRNNSGSNDDAPLPQPKRGTRFAPEVYAVHPGSSTSDGQQISEETGIVHQPVGRRFAKAGSRFPPEVYARQAAAAQQDDHDGLPQTRDSEMHAVHHACGKHTLTAEEHEANPRSPKIQGIEVLPPASSQQFHPFRDASWSTDPSQPHETYQSGGGGSSCGGGGGSCFSGRPADCGNSSPHSSHHHHPMHTYSTSCGGGGPPGHYMRDRFSIDLPGNNTSAHSTCLSLSSESSMSLSPTSATAYEHGFAGPGRRPLTGSMSLDATTNRQIANFSYEGGNGLLRSMPSRDYTQVMTVRPINKKRSYKPLTQEQQQLFNVF